ncbi:MAG: M48 family metalloprotease [Halodesulfurarchaeum sp.]
MVLRRWLARATLGILLLLTLGVRAHARTREFAADGRAADVTGKPRTLARALRGIKRATQRHRRLLSPRFIPGEDDQDSRIRALSTHPSLTDRIERLESEAEQGR